MIVQIPKYSEQLLSEFAQKEWGKAKAYLTKHFTSFSEMECEDIFQESFVVLFQNNRKGKLDNLSCSLSTYFMSICRNKALELQRAKSHSLNVGTDSELDMLDEIKDDKLDSLIAMDPETSLVESKEAIARQIVRDLPQPCDDLLWGFFRNNYSLKTLADILGKTVGYVKVTKHRCQEKFRKHWNDLAKNLF